MVVWQNRLVKLMEEGPSTKGREEVLISTFWKDQKIFNFLKNQIHRSQGTNLFLFQKQSGVELKPTKVSLGYINRSYWILSCICQVSLCSSFFFFQNSELSKVFDKKARIASSKWIPICYCNQHYDYMKSNLFISQKGFFTFWIWNFSL